MAFFLEQFGITGQNYPSFFLCDTLHGLEVAHIHVLAVDSQVPHHRAQLLKHAIDQKFGFVCLHNFRELLMVHHMITSDQFIKVCLGLGFVHGFRKANFLIHQPLIEFQADKSIESCVVKLGLLERSSVPVGPLLEFGQFFAQHHFTHERKGSLNFVRILLLKDF